jgi:RNA polymerase-binding transcription factor DksA
MPGVGVMAAFPSLYTRRLDRLLNSNDSNTLFTSTRRQEAINDGYQEFAALTECYRRRSTITVSCTTTEYVLSPISEFTRITDQRLLEYHHVADGSESEDFTEAELDATTLQEVQAALRRIESGTYGRCLIDGAPIDPK